MAVPLTPLLPYYQGTAVAGAWFSWTAPLACQVTRYRLTAGTAPTGSSLTVSIQKNGVTQATITLTAGSTDTGYTTAAIAFAQGDILAFVIASVGSTTAGANLQLIADISATTVTQVTPTQTPYLIEQAGAIAVASVFTYTFLRTVSMKSALFTLRSAPAGSSAIVVVKNGATVVATLTILANAITSGSTVLSSTFVPGDIMTVSVTQIGSTTAGSDLSVLLDYTISDLIGALVGQYYSEPDSEVIAFLKQIGIGNARADSITTADLTPYKQRANDIIDSRLAAVYRTPIKTITRNLKTNYPEPITHVAQRIVGFLLVNDVFSEVEPNASSNVQRQYNMALEDLESLASRRTLLKGTRQRARNYGSNPYTEPLLPFSAASAPPGAASPIT